LGFNWDNGTGKLGTDLVEENVVTGFVRGAGLTFLKTFIGVNFGIACVLGGRITLEAVVAVLVFTMLLLSDITFISEMDVAVLSRGLRVNRVVTPSPGLGLGEAAGTDLKCTVLNSL